MPEDTNEMEQRNFEKMISEMLKNVKQAMAQLEAEEKATEVLEGQNGRYLIHLN